ncbi:hypothetical protein RJT34_33080 [Clitoria ternatea]|uniref:Uncharacterized protein n=1 Tax=Clitoria ternatea TaxID=43366 RepID=A0AAN9EZ88_CLITE
MDRNLLPIHPLYTSYDRNRDCAHCYPILVFRTNFQVPLHKLLLSSSLTSSLSIHSIILFSFPPNRSYPHSLLLHSKVSSFPTPISETPKTHERNR